MRPNLYTRTPAAAALVLAGCVGVTGAPSPDGLAYDRPDPNPATYTFADTTELSIETPVGPMEVLTALAGTAELEFRGRDHDFQAFVRFPELSGVFRNPMQDPAVVDAADIEGPFTVRVGPRGLTEVTDTPSLAGVLGDITGPETLVRSLFVLLPGRPVATGDSWVDTVRVVEETADARSMTTSIITSSIVGDTVVDDRRLLQIRTTSEVETQLTGSAGGVALEQVLAGTGVGQVLWDEAAHLVFQRTETASLTGTMALPEVGGPPMAVRVSVNQTVTLRP
jgi:hypothetical protein